MKIKIVVLGGGPGGYTAALRAAELGAETVVIEKDNLGGTCLNRGCIPSKIMKTSADLLEKFRKSSDFGITLKGEVSPDIKALMVKKENIIKTHINGLDALLKKNKIKLIKGKGQVQKNSVDILDDNGNVVGNEKWDTLIIASGTDIFSLPFIPFDKEQILSSDDILSIKEIPESLAILGGGVIGAEFACIMSALGSKVTVIETLPRILPIPSIDEDSSKILEREMKKKKIKILTSNTVKNVKKGERLIISLESGEKIEAEKMLVCVGRKSNAKDIGLDKLSDLKIDERGWVFADEYMQTSMKNVFAIGDILGPSKIMLAHVAAKEGIVAAENAMGNRKKMDYKAVPQAIFTSPEVASIGITEQDIKKDNLEARADIMMYRNIGKAHVIGEIAGHIKIISDIKTKKILGVHIIGAHATELIAEACLAVNNRITLKELTDTIHAHPTLSELMLEVGYKALDMSI